ncbi:hypothetical protein PLESTB_000722000 [Pleodorina starrii]|uniref:F-box domain-containing protein n=1 Tax=Pleodorina starrii TaxID=330485 RepID=A0A9W6BJY6_9CHLO|nr:hypothetical protein PLESTM_001705500 [Pleodorina starrii]GLC53228.1 hypothetical protein PLESTB_000722000 [Pleodorina starrii]GLC68683.1 hypothetical protein PLESTF_000722600 [Pleodorina starrii]
MAAGAARSCAPGYLLSLPLELQLRVLEGLGGQDLCAVEASCRDLRRLVAGNTHLYQLALVEDFRCTLAAAPPSINWKAQYVDMFIRARLKTLEQHQRVCQVLKERLDELDDLLGDADDVRQVLGAPELLTSEPCLVLAIVGNMEQEALQQRWDASQDLLMAESKLRVVQAEMQDLLARIPRYWWPAALQTAAAWGYAPA